MAQSASDQRRTTRVGAPKVVVRIPSADRFRSHYLKDLSEGGLFIRASAQLPVGSELSIELWAPEEVRAIQLPAKVLRSVTSGSTGFDGEPGMAVAFTSVSPEDARRLKALIDAHAEGSGQRPLPMPAAPASGALGQVQQLVTDLAEARQTNARLEEEISHVRLELSAAEERFRRTQVEMANAQSALSQVTARRDQLEAECRQLKAEALAANRLLETERSTGEVATLRGKVAELSRSLEDVRARDLELTKVLSGATVRSAGAPPAPAAGRKPQAQIVEDIPDDEIIIERPSETAITTDSVEFAFDQMAGNEDPTVARSTQKAAVVDEPLFAIEDIDFGVGTVAKPKADPLDSFLGNFGMPDEKTDVQLNVEIETEAPALAGGRAGFVMGASIADGRKAYEHFTKDLKRNTRLMPSAELHTRKPGSVDEVLLTEMLSASPTFGTVITQMGSQVKEERLRQMLYELYARGLLDLRDY